MIAVQHSISQNIIIGLEKELVGTNNWVDSETLRADNAEAENLKPKDENKMLKNQLQLSPGALRFRGSIPLKGS